MTRFARYVEITPTCWLWTGAQNKGYGMFQASSYVTRLAHRWFYERIRGPLDPTLSLDHLCRVKNCVRISHLEPVTFGENARRGNVNSDTCKAGLHAWVPENIRVRADRPTRGECKPCGLLGEQRRRRERASA